jgi:cell division protein FtsL
VKQLFDPGKKRKKINMDKKLNNIIYMAIILILLICILFMANKSITINLNDDSKEKPIDYQIEDLKDCYLTIHNFVSINSSIQDRSMKNKSTIKNKYDFKTFIYSYTKPFLLEMVQNSTKDCLCCSN